MQIHTVHTVGGAWRNTGIISALIKAGNPFTAAIYGQIPCIYMDKTQCQLYMCTFFKIYNTSMLFDCQIICKVGAAVLNFISLSCLFYLELILREIQFSSQNTIECVFRL